MNDQFLKVAKDAALAAGKIIAKYSGEDLQKNIKHGDGSDFATEADLKAEKTIVSMISKVFPEHNIIAEEDEKVDRGSEYTWVIDPLDGTFSFSVGMPYYAVSIGLLKEGKPVLGVIYHVQAKDLYYATEGEGAFLNGKRITVSKRDKLEESGVTLDAGHRGKRQHKLDLYVNNFMTKIGMSYSVGSAVVTLAYIAQGIFDAVINEAYLWDFAAGTIIIREAGGKVTDFEGNEPDWSKQRLSIVASNGLLHDQILEALKK